MYWDIYSDPGVEAIEMMETLPWCSGHFSYCREQAEDSGQQCASGGGTQSARGTPRTLVGFTKSKGLGERISRLIWIKCKRENIGHFKGSTE